MNLQGKAKVLPPQCRDKGGIMGFGEMAALMYLTKTSERENKNASQLRSMHNDLTSKYNHLIDTAHGLEARVSELKDSVQFQRNRYIAEDKLSTTLHEERMELRGEVATLKDFIDEQGTLIEKMRVFDEGRISTITSQRDTIKELTDRNVSLVEEVKVAESNFAIHSFATETVRQGMSYIPEKVRIKVAAETFVRNPSFSQAKGERTLSDEQKQSIEIHATNILFPELGSSRTRINTLYDQAKEDVKNKIVEAKKGLEEAVEIRSALFQQAKDNGADTTKIPDVWKIQAKMARNKSLEAKATDQEDLSLDQSNSSPRM